MLATIINKMKDEPPSRSYAITDLEKLEGYIKRPEGLVFESDKNFLENLELMRDLAIKLKKDTSLAYFPKELKNDEDFMLSLIEIRPNAYNYAGQKLSKSPEFAIRAIQVNPESIDAVFFKHENFFNNIQVINEALKHEESDFFNVTDEIDEHIHKKNICSKADLLEMFSRKKRAEYLVRMYENQVLEFYEDLPFMDSVLEKNYFDVSGLNETNKQSTTQTHKLKM